MVGTRPAMGPLMPISKTAAVPLVRLHANDRSERPDGRQGERDEIGQAGIDPIRQACMKWPISWHNRMVMMAEEYFRAAQRAAAGMCRQLAGSAGVAHTRYARKVLRHVATNKPSGTAIRRWCRGGTHCGAPISGTTCTITSGCPGQPRTGPISLGWFSSISPVNYIVAGRRKQGQGCPFHHPVGWDEIRVPPIETSAGVSGGTRNSSHPTVVAQLKPTYNSHDGRPTPLGLAGSTSHSAAAGVACPRQHSARRGLSETVCPPARLEDVYRIEILPPALANTLGDQGLVEEILQHGPWLVAFTCYLWNIERTLWIAAGLRRAEPAVSVLLGGPEITPDNRWVLDQPEVDLAVFGEGEQTLAELLEQAACQPEALAGTSRRPSLAFRVGIPSPGCGSRGEPPAAAHPLGQPRCRFVALLGRNPRRRRGARPASWKRPAAAAIAAATAIIRRARRRCHTLGRALRPA